MIVTKKYNNVKMSVNGIGIFDSKKEYDRYLQLSIMQNAGIISELRRQVSYELIPAQYETYERYGKKGNRLKDGKRCIEKSLNYKADFVYRKGGETVVEDVKGFKTKEYIIKRKLMLYIHGIKIKET